MWQATWDESPLNKLHEIAPIVNEPRTHHLSTRRDQSVFNRCRIGHSRLTHEFLLKGEPPPECIPCNCLLTIKHLLIECVDFNDVRQRFYQVPSLQDLNLHSLTHSLVRWTHSFAKCVVHAWHIPLLQQAGFYGSPSNWMRQIIHTSWPWCLKRPVRNAASTFLGRVFKRLAVVCRL